MSIAPPENAPVPPSDAELRILRRLWMDGELTVAEIHARVEPDWDIGYTTVLKLLQRMLEKGLVDRDEARRAHRYRAAVTESATERRLAKEILERTFEGSLRRLVQAALPAARPREKELAEIRRLLDEEES